MALFSERPKVPKKDTPRNAGEGGNTFPYLFVVPMTNGSYRSYVYTPERNDKGDFIPLNESTFFDSLRRNESVKYQEIAGEQEVPTALLYGIANYQAPPDDAQAKQQVQNSIKQDTQTVSTITPSGVVPPAPAVKVSTPGYTGPLMSEETNKVINRTNKVVPPSPNLFHVSEENLEEYKDAAMSSPVVVARNTTNDDYEDMDDSPVAAVATMLLAQNVRGITDADVAHITNKELEEVFESYMLKNGRTVTPEDKANFVKAVRSYKPDTRFPLSADTDVQAIRTYLQGEDVAMYNTRLTRGGAVYAGGWYENWYENRGIPHTEIELDKFSNSPELMRAVEFYQDPANHLNTMLDEKDEEKFQDWFQQEKDNGNIPEVDVGIDYDYRGYWKTYASKGRDARVNGHYPDMFKKPNHPTFSTDSIWANTEFKGFAGTWGKDGYVPAEVQYPRENQLRYLKYINDTAITVDEAAYNIGVASSKQILGVIEDNPALEQDGTVTGFASPLDIFTALMLYGKPDARAGNVIMMGSFLAAYLNNKEGGGYNATMMIPYSEYKTQLEAAIKEYGEQLAATDTYNILARKGIYGEPLDTVIPNSPENPAGESLTVGAVRNKAINAMYTSPNDIMKHMFPELAEADSNLRSEAAQVAALYPSGETGNADQFNKAKQKYEDDLKAYTFNRLLLQDTYFSGNTPLLFDQATELDYITRFNSGQANADDIARLAQQIGGNFVLANAAARQFGTEYDTRNREVLVSQMGRKSDVILDENKQVAGGYLSGAASWAAVMPAYMGTKGNTSNRYLLVANGHTADFYDKAPSKVKQDAWKIVTNELGWLNDRLYKTFGTDQAGMITLATSPLAEMFVQLGFQNDSGIFEATFVKQEMQRFKDTFMVSDRFPVLIDKDSAKIVGIETTEQMDAGLHYALSQAKAGVEAGSLVLIPGLANVDSADNIVLKNSVSSIKPMVSGNMIYFAAYGKDGNYDILLQQNDAGVRQPYYIKLSDVFASGRYASKDYANFTETTGLELPTTVYTDTLENYQAGLYPGYTERRYRGKTARFLHNVAMLYNGDRSISVTQEQMTALGNQYYSMLNGLEVMLNASPYRRAGITNEDVENYLLDKLVNSPRWQAYLRGTISVSHTPSFMDSTFVDIPIVQQAFYGTYVHFTTPTAVQQSIDASQQLAKTSVGTPLFYANAAIFELPAFIKQLKEVGNRYFPARKQDTEQIQQQQEDALRRMRGQ